MKNWRLLFLQRFLFVLLLLLIPSFSYAGTKKEISEIKKELSDVKKELQEIKRLLISPRPQPPIPPTPSLTEAQASIDDDPLLGKSDAPITLIEFSDYQCPFCARFYRDTFPQIKKDYIDKGKVRYIFRDFPLLSIHPKAQMAAEAAQCAGEQDKYWKMHDILFENQGSMETENLKGYAERLGLNMDDFNKCLEQSRYTNEVKNDIQAGEGAGVQGVPAFIIGRTTDDGNIKGKFIRGAHPYLTFETAIEEILKGKEE
jgi:protein-disulfide isomerase